jgi:hypothetical protein
MQRIDLPQLALFHGDARRYLAIVVASETYLPGQRVLPAGKNVALINH